jgi:esterase
VIPNGVAALHFEIVASEADAQPTHWLAMTHGIFGSGANWRSIARKAISQLPGWGAVLIDLRGHGKSERGVAPFTVAACAQDLANTLQLLANNGHAVDALCGHSFGGKVVLALGSLAGIDLPSRIMLDSNPGVRILTGDEASGVPAVLAMLESLPRDWSSRDAFVSAVENSGQSRSIAQWLGLSVNRVGDHFRLQLEIDAIRLMLDDYFQQDLWHLVATSNTELTVVVASRATTFSTVDRERLAALKTSLVDVRYVEAGHWLHVEAPAAVVENIVFCCRRTLNKIDSST